MGNPRLRSNKLLPYYQCTGHQHCACNCAPHCPPPKRGQGAIHAHLHPRSARSPSRRTSSPHHPRPCVPLPSLHCHHVQRGMHSDVTFTKINCTIVYRGRTIVCGHKCTKTGLWMVPLQGTHARAASSPTVLSEPTTEPTFAIAANVEATSSAVEYARYIHQ
jgi:hypothetical protein